MRLSPVEIESALASLAGWTSDGQAIDKTFTFDGFPDAIAFIVRLAFAAEAVDHHPDLTINYRRVKVSYSTHSEGGITEKDVEGARSAERLAAA